MGNSIVTPGINGINACSGLGCIIRFMIFIKKKKNP
jgi:hypothetical protein